MIEPMVDHFDGVRRIGVVADTHIPDRVRTLHPELIPRLRSAEVDLIFHAGDISSPVVLTELAKVAPVVAVRGNRDWAFAGSLPWKRVITIGHLRIAMQHGMGDFWHYWLDKMKYAVVGYQFPRYRKLMQNTAPGYDVYVFGHTHRTENHSEGGKLYFNPGAASITPLIKFTPTFGILHLDNSGSVRGEIIGLSRLQVDRGSWVHPEGG